LKRGYYTTEAIILDLKDYSESDRIITFYTKKYGKLCGIAKGARRSKKRFVGNLEPSSYLRLLFFQTGKSELIRVEAATLVEGFNSLRGDIARFGGACYMLELSNELTREGIGSRVFFDTLLSFLFLLDKKESHPFVLNFFEIKALKISGYLPHLTGCVACRGELSGEGAFFSCEKGGVLCKRCVGFSGDALPISPGTAGFFSMAAKLDVEKIERLVPNPLIMREGERVLTSFIQYQLGKELKSKNFMEKIRQGRF